jgi:hypothetical protein
LHDETEASAHAHRCAYRAGQAEKYYKRTVGNEGLRTIIVGHEKRALTNLFQLGKRFEHMPEDMRPSTTSNAEGLILDNSGYLAPVATMEGAAAQQPSNIRR